MLNLLHDYKRLLVVAFMMATSLGISAQTQITDEAGLKAIADDLAGSYVLANDITLSGEWSPIGSQTAPFTGKLDGAGHSIKNLVITSKTDNVGLFSFTQGATLTNIRFPQVSIAGNKQAGALAGQAIATDISQIFVSGVITGVDHVGGIVGDVRGNATEGNYTTVENCISTAMAWSDIHQAGVLVGWINAGILSHNIVLGSAFAPSNGAGGIAPIVDNGSAELDGCVAAPAVIYGYGSGNTHRSHAIVGFINGKESTLVTTNCLSSTASRIFESGVLVTDLSQLNPDFQGKLTSPEDLMKVSTYTGIGFDLAMWNLTDGKYPILKNMTYPIDGDAIVLKDVPEVAAQGGTFNPYAFSALGRSVTITSSNPDVVAVVGSTLSFVGLGEATVTYTTTGDDFSLGATRTQKFIVSGQNYNINTVDDLLNMKNNLGGDYTLEADIDMTDVEFSPFGDFTGTFDGKGHVIKGLKYNNSRQNNVALFSTAHGATIKNVGFVEANIVGNANVAAIVGRAYGSTIQNCYVANSYIEGGDHVASIAGDANHNDDVLTTIADCIANAKIKSRAYQAGGIAGVANGANIQRNLFCGIVDLPEGNVAGLVSLLDNNDWEKYKTTFSNNFSAPAHLFGRVSLEERLIHLSNRGANFENNYALASTLTSASGGTLSGAGNADGPSGASVTAGEARTKDFYVSTLGWDFNDTWKFFEGTEGKMYPVLKWMTAPLPEEVFDLPENVTLLYKDGSENLDPSLIHSSWGELFDFDIISGGEYVTYTDIGDGSGPRFWIGDNDGNYAGSGDVVVKIKTSLPDALKLTSEVTFKFFVGKSGDKNEIKTAEDFQSISRNVDGDYILVNDIDFTNVTFEAIPEFRGTLDGQGHKIMNLTVNGDKNDFGVFCKTSGAKISNIAFQDLKIVAQKNNHVGLIGSAASTTFEQVAVTGAIYGVDHVAAFAGDGDGCIVNNCYADVYIYAYSQVGGFFGCTLVGGATFTNSYFNGSLTAYTRGWVGGFVGLVDKSGSTVSIKNCVSIGNLHSVGEGTPHYVGQFIGGNGAGNNPNAVVFFENNIANSQAVMEGDADWPSRNETAEGGSVVPAENVSANILQSQTGYQDLGWDWENVWAFDSSSLYPILKKIGLVANGIENISVVPAATADGRIYNLAGQRVSEDYKGIVIKNGAKHLNK